MMMQQQIPAGLGALLSQQKQQRPAGGNIPAGMQALIQAQRVLQQQAAPTTPDGRPTVAGMTEQAINQQAQPQQLPMQQMPGMMPADPYRQQLMQTLQAQAQAQGAPQQAAPQQPPAQPQGMARGGLASLRADNIARMKYAKGGVIGFDGTDDSYVNVPIYPTKSNQDLNVDEQQKQIDALQSAKAEVEKKLGKYGLRQRAIDPEGFAALQSILGNVNENLNVAKDIGEATRWKERNKLEQMVPSAQAGSVNPTIRQLMAPEKQAQASAPDYTQDISPPATVRPAGIAAAPRSPVSAPRAAAPAASAALAAQAPAAPSYQELFTQAQKLVGTDEAEKRLRALQAQKDVLAKERPDIEGLGIAALEQHAAERQRLLEQERGGDFTRRLGAFAEGLYKKDTGTLGRVDDLLAQRDRSANDAVLATEQMKLKLRDAQQARKVGDIDTAMGLEKQIADLNEKRMGHIKDAANASALLSGHIYTAQQHLQGVRETNLSHERQKASELAQRAQELGQSKLATSLTAANHQVDNAQKAVDMALEKQYGMLTKMEQMSPETAAKNPQYQEYLKAKQQLYAQHVLPAMQVRQSLMSKFLGAEGAPTTMKFDSSGNPIK